jgi:hypothetical protein
MKITNTNVKSVYNGSQWVRLQRVVPKFFWHEGHPAGYTDDLGIIADRNQWVEAQRRGWQSEIDPQDYQEIREWCLQNLKHGTWHTGLFYILIDNDADVAWFMLRWG